MLRIYRIMLVPLILALLAGCMPNPGISDISKKSLQSTKPRAAAPQISDADQSALAVGDNAFAMDLYHKLNQPGKNFFYSPYSISLALAMTYGGARGNTASQMAQVLHFTLPQDRLHPAFNALDQQLAARKNTPGQGADGKGFRLNVVNDIWGQQDYTFLPDYLDLLAVNYGAGLRPMDFKQNPDQARQTINDYIAQKTEQRIKDLIPAGAITPDIRLVLTNAIYFNAAWQFPFIKESTQPAPFTRLDGTQANMPMMHMLGDEFLSYAAGDGYQAVALPYEGGQLSMLILVPDAGKFADFETGLDAARLETILGQMQPASVQISMPKFSMDSEFSLGKTLPAMGMQDAFTPNTADFSGMDGSRNLYISEVVHKAFVKVDEAGTEAAAATAVMVMAASARAQFITLIIDRPFIVLIRDEPTNTILFAGRVLDPQK